MTGPPKTDVVLQFIEKPKRCVTSCGVCSHAVHALFSLSPEAQAAHRRLKLEATTGRGGVEGKKRVGAQDGEWVCDDQAHPVITGGRVQSCTAQGDGWVEAQATRTRLGAANGCVALTLARSVE